MGRRVFTIRCWVAALAILAALGCATVPHTERRQLAFVPNQQLSALSVDTYSQMLRESTLSEDPEQVELVRGVGEDLARATEAYLRSNGLSTTDYSWEFNVIKDDDMVNAWCLPGGKIAVYTGILLYTQDADGLAVVMGHEIAHAVARHGNERLSQRLLVELGKAALEEAIKEKPERTRQLFQLSYGAASTVGVMLPYSRLHEREADRIGLTLMAMAGYDPRAAIPFWERMDEAAGRRPPQFLSTHPVPANRVEQIRASLPEALAIYEAR